MIERIMGLVLILACALPAMAQQTDTYKKVGDKVEVTKYYEDGTVKEVGTFKGENPDGVWVEYNRDGSIKTEANYVDGKKEGKWFVWSQDGKFLYEVKYENNAIAEAHRWEISERNALVNN